MLARHRDLDALRNDLTRWLERRLPSARELTVSPLKQPGAGLSNETYLFDLSWQQDGRAHAQSLVVRLEPTDFLVFPEYDLRKQFRVLECLSETDVPVPRVRWFEGDPAVLGCAFYVMERLDGTVPSEVPPYHSFGLLHDATPARRAAMWWSGVETLARIHRLDWQRLGLSFVGVPGSGTDPLDQQIAYYERYLDWVQSPSPQPILRAAFEWVKRHGFTPARLSLCWGDSRLPNMIFRDDAVVGVLDWEMCFLGDPEADLGWWLFMDWSSCDGYGLPRLEGLPTKSETIARYEELTGQPVRQALYCEVWAALRFGVIMARVAQRLKEIGAPIPTPDFEANNVCTHRLAELLDLPPPGGVKRPAAETRGGAVHVQFHLTGAGGHDWYVVAENSGGARHEGTAAAPDVTVTASAADWEAIQRGDLARTDAFLSGKLKIDGDFNILMRLEDTISKLSRQ